MDLNLKGRGNGELKDLFSRLLDRAMAYGIEDSTEKSKVMANSMINISADISMKSQKLEEVTSFKYLGATLCMDCFCSTEVHIRIASAMARVKGSVGATP